MEQILKSRNISKTKAYKVLSVLSLITLIGFIFYNIIEAKGLVGEDIGIVETLKVSSLARIMFTDIGILSTICAGFVIFATEIRFKTLFAILIICLGSFGLLSFLTLYFAALSYRESERFDI